MAQAKHVTITDIAKKADVSIATVSRVLNNKKHVNGKTVEKVKSAMEALNYHAKDQMAVIPKTLIILFLPMGENPFYSSLSQGIYDTAKRYGYCVFTCQIETDDDAYIAMSTINQYDIVAGIINVDHIFQEETIKYLQSFCPLVQCCEACESSENSCVGIDDKAAAIKVVEYLLSTGRRKIALINSTLDHNYARQRELGYREALEKAGIGINEEWIVRLSHISYDNALFAATQLLLKKETPDAFFAISDIYAAAVIKAAKQCLLNVPKDISVVGFDNIDLTTIIDPSITTVNQPRYQIGCLSCDILLGHIKQPSTSIQRIYLGTELLVRASTLNI